jgi:hypothetical protein
VLHRARYQKEGVIMNLFFWRNPNPIHAAAARAAYNQFSVKLTPRAVNAALHKCYKAIRRVMVDAQSTDVVIGTVYLGTFYEENEPDDIDEPDFMCAATKQEDAHYRMLANKVRSYLIQEDYVVQFRTQLSKRDIGEHYTEYWYERQYILNISWRAR